MSFWTRESQFQPILLRREYVEITAGLASAILLSQLVYWFKPSKGGKTKLTIIREGRYWLAKTKDDWHRECGLTPRGYRTAIAELTESGVVETRLWKFGGRPVTHYWLDVERLDALIQFHDPGFVADESDSVDSVDPTQSTLSIWHTPPCHFDTMESDVSTPSLYTEITAENTAKITSTVQQAALGNAGVGSLNGFEEGTENMVTMKASKQLAVAKYAGQTAGEMLKGMMTKKESASDVSDALHLRWKKEYGGVYGEFHGEVTMADKGKLGHIAKAIGKEKALEVVSWAVRDWQKYAARVRDQKGLAGVPERPVIGFLLMHYGVALEAMTEKSSDSVVSTPSTLTKWQGKEQNAESVQSIAKPQKQVAGDDEVAAAIKDLGL